MTEYYENGPEGMPRVERMTRSTIMAVLSQKDVPTIYVSREEDYNSLCKFAHAVAEETLARVPAWPTKRTTAPVSLTEDDLTQEFSLDAIINGLVYENANRIEGWKSELKEYIRIECNRALLAAAPAPIQKDPQAAQLVTTTYAKAHSTTVIVNLVKGNLTTCLYSADHSANGKTIGVSDLPDGLSLAVKQSPEPCGGCGETDPSKRCIGCCHPFSELSPAVTMEPATPPALAGSQVQAAGDAVDAARYRWLREKRDIPHGSRNIPWVVALDPEEKIHTMILRAGIDLDHAIDAAMREQP